MKPRSEYLKEIVDGFETCLGFPQAVRVIDGMHTLHFLKTQIRGRPHPLIKLYHTHNEYHLNVMNIIKMS